MDIIFRKKAPESLPDHRYPIEAHFIEICPIWA